MLTCNNCDFLEDISITSFHKEILTNFCEKIPVGNLSNVVTTFDEDGEHPFLIINNPYKFGCILHSKMKDYYKRITIDEKIPNDPRIKIK